MSYADAINALNPDSPQHAREAVWSQLLAAPPIDRDRELKKAALRLAVPLTTVKEEFKAQKKRAEAEEAESRLRAQAGEDCDELPDLDQCLDEGKDFVPCCVAALTGDADYSIENVAKKAEEAGRVIDFERAHELAAQIAESKRAWELAADKIGVGLKRVYSGAIVKLVAKKDAPPIPVLVSSPIIICAEGSNGANTNPHLKLKVRAANGIWNELVLARTSLGKGDWQAQLLNAGLKIGDADTLLRLLKTVGAPKRFQLFEKPGWNGECYVLPNGQVIGTDECEIAFKPLKGYGPQGEKDKADSLIFKQCENNSRLTLAACASLAALFLKYTNVEPGGFHIHGPSGTGKTTTLLVAASVWGSGADPASGGIVGTWRATDNGVEAEAAWHMDAPFIRTEIKQCKPSTAQQVIYMLGNGTGKQAMTRDREAREVLTFRTMVLSDGELSTAAHIESDSNLSYDAGASARVHDIPADTGKGFGVFEDLHGAETPKEFAEALTRAASEHFGHHGRALVEHLVSHREETLAWVRDKMGEIYNDFTAETQIGGADQEGRVVKRFALCASVGELATELGIMPWTAGAARAGVRDCLLDWIAARGHGDLEALAAHRAFSQFVFSQQDRADLLNLPREARRNRAFIEQQTKDGKREYWFTAESLAEACGQPQRVEPFLKYLEKGLSDEWGLVTDQDGKRKTRSVPKRLGVTCKRMYCLVSKIDPPLLPVTTKSPKRQLWRVRKRAEPSVPKSRRNRLH